MARALCVCIAVFVSCGGSAQDDRSVDGAGGTGASVSGRDASGGVAGTSGSSGSAASAGTSGGVDAGDTCLLPPDSGNCLAAMQRYYFDAALGECAPFTYGGCGGNENNFATLEECQAGCARAVSCTCDGTNCPADCSLCPSTRDAEGTACDYIGSFTCTYLSTCGWQNECTCTVAPTIGPHWDCAFAPC